MKMFKSSEIKNPALWNHIKNKYGVDGAVVPMLPYAGSIGLETRKLYFGFTVTGGKITTGDKLVGYDPTRHAGKQLPVNRIISYGDCNVACPYCKRDCQFIDDQGSILGTADVSIDDILRLCIAAVDDGETPRFSGGDPVSFKKETTAIVEYLYLEKGVKSSIAHNGSWGKTIGSIAPMLSSAAIDLKGIPSKLGKIMGIKVSAGDNMYTQSLKTQAELIQHGVLVDVRTPVFGDTTTEDMMSLAKDISKNDPEFTFWTWRLYKPVEGIDWSVPNRDTIIQQMLDVSKYYPSLWMGMRAKWQEGGMVYVKNGKIIDLSEGGTTEKSGSGNQLLN